MGVTVVIIFVSFAVNGKSRTCILSATIEVENFNGFDVDTLAMIVKDIEKKEKYDDGSVALISFCEIK